MLCNDAARQQMNHIPHAVVSLVRFAWKPVWCEPILDGRSADAATRFIAFVIEIVLPSLLPLAGPWCLCIHSVIHCVMSKGDSMVFTDTVLEACAPQRVRLYSEIGNCTNACAGALGNIIHKNHFRTGMDMVGGIDCTKSCDINIRPRGRCNRSTIHRPRHLGLVVGWLALELFHCRNLQILY